MFEYIFLGLLLIFCLGFGLYLFVRYARELRTMQKARGVF